MKKLPNFGRLLHQHYIESQLLVGQLLLPSCCYCTVGSVVALAVGGAGAVGCALIVTGVADDTQVLSEIRLVLKECGPAVNNEKLPNFGRLLHQHYIESQLLVGQLLLPFLLLLHK
jgi:hypothetical protein